MSEQQETKIEEKELNNQVPVATSAAEEETPQQIDWKKFKEARQREREQAAKDRAEMLEAKKREEAYKKAMEALVNKPLPPAESHDESEEDIIQKKIDAALAAERQRVAEEQRKREQAEFPQRLAQAYNDFDEVCSTENLDYLEFHHPEIAKAFSQLPDSFDKWQSVYKAVKKYVPATSVKKEQVRADRNLNKPQSMSSPGANKTGDMAPSHALDQKRKDDNWARMRKRMKGLI